MSSISKENPIWLLIPVTLSLLIAGWAYMRFVKRLPAAQRRFLTRAILLYVGIQLLLSLTFGLRYRVDVDSVARLAGYLPTIVAQIAILVAAIAFIRFWHPTLLMPDAISSQDESDALSRERLSLILKSDDFLTALNESLPKGTTDSEHGLDYVPYLLQAVRTRRDRFDVSSRRFLRLTLTLGVVTAAIVATFGWVLLDESAVGAPRALRDVRDTLDELVVAARNVTVDYAESPEYHQVTQILGLNVNPRVAPLQEQLRLLTDRQASAPADLDAFIRNVRAVTTTFRPVDESERVFVGNLKSAIDALDAWRKRQQQLAGEIAKNNARLARVMPQLEASIGKDETRLAELIRRLAIGIVVATFFLALVRFVGSLYRADYREMLRADLDDMFVRSFYVSYKAAGTDQQQRAAVLSAMVGAMTSARRLLEDAPSPTANKKEELEIVKELINAAAKKL